MQNNKQNMNNRSRQETERISRVFEKIDTSMFNSKELAEITKDMNRYLKQHRSVNSYIKTAREKRFVPLYRSFLLPLWVCLISILLLVIIYVYYLINTNSQYQSYIRFFGTRITQTDSADASESNRAFIQVIHDTTERQLMALFIKAINVENAEFAPASAAEQAVRQKQIESEQALRNEDINTVLSELPTERSPSTQIDYQALRALSNQANLQLDQYNTLLTEIRAAIVAENTIRIADLMSQLETYLNQDILNDRPFFSSLIETGHVVMQTISAYLASRTTQTADVVTAAESEQSNNDSPQEIAEEGALIDEVEQLTSDKSTLIQQNRELTLQVEQFLQEISTLRQRLSKLSNEQ